MPELEAPQHILFWFWTSSALEARQLSSSKTSIQKSIHFGPPLLQSSFRLRVVLKKGLFSDLQSSSCWTVNFYKERVWEKHWFWTPWALKASELISIKSCIEKSIDFGLPELQSAFRFRVALRKTAISDLQSSRCSPVTFYNAFQYGKHWFEISRTLKAPELISIKNCIEKSIDSGPPELYMLDVEFQ